MRCTFMFCLLASMAILLPSAAANAQAGNVPTSEYPPYIRGLADKGAQVRYLGKNLGLDSWLTVKAGKVQYVYVTPNQEANIVGILLDKYGNPVSPSGLENIARNAPPAAGPLSSGLSANEAMSVARKTSPQGQGNTSSKAEMLYQAFENANYIEIGAADAPLAYALIDPDCPHCHAFIKELLDKNVFEERRLRLRVIPVGILSGDSLARAAMLLSMPEAGQVLINHINGDKDVIPVSEDVTLAGVETNMRLMQDWNLDVTPFLLYRAGTGELKIIRGKPKDSNTFLKDLVVN